MPSRALINKQFCRHSTEGSRDPAPVAGSSGQTLGRGCRVSATAILRRNPDGANRARDNRYGNGRSLGCKWRRLTPSRGNYSNLMLDQFGMDTAGGRSLRSITGRLWRSLRQPLFGTFALAEAAVCAFGDALGPAQAQHTPLVQNLVVRPVNRRDRRSQIVVRIRGSRPRRDR